MKTKPKPPPPEIVEHHCYVVRVYQRTRDGKWFFTTTKDGIQVFKSGDFKEKPKFALS